MYNVIHYVRSRSCLLRARPGNGSSLYVHIRLPCRSNEFALKNHPPTSSNERVPDRVERKTRWEKRRRTNDAAQTLTGSPSDCTSLTTTRFTSTESGVTTWAYLCPRKRINVLGQVQGKKIEFRPFTHSRNRGGGTDF